MNIGIYGYGNLGRAVEIMTESFCDINLRAVFTRRPPDEVRARTPHVYSRCEVENFVSEIDCMLLCGGSRNDTREDAENISKIFNTVDSFDMHELIGEHKERVFSSASESGHTSIVSVGWDPGVLSLFRALFSSVIPRAKINTFWGRGVSQGHSEAIKRIKGVRRAVQYTVPRPEAIPLARSGIILSDTERHRRECYVVAECGEEQRIEREILDMPIYFAPYETKVHFIDEETFLREHIFMPHSGLCLASGMSGVYSEHATRAELSLSLDSNPEFTASVMLAAARACVRMAKEEKHGAFSLLDIPMSYLMHKDDYYKYL